MAGLTGKGGESADELGEHLVDVVVVVWRVAHDLLQGVHAADADIQFDGAESFEGNGEPTPILTTAIRACRYFSLRCSSRAASPRTQPPATRFSQAPTGPPTPVAAHLWPHPNTAVYQFREFSLTERPARGNRGRLGSDRPDHRGFAASTG